MSDQNAPNPQPLPPPATEQSSGCAASPPAPLRVAALADYHATRSTGGTQRALFAEIGANAEVLLLCGDLTNTGLPEEAENLAADLAGLRIPIGAVLGNHDCHAGRVEEVKAVLRRANVRFLDDEPLCVHGVGFAGVKGFGGGFAGHMLDPFGEEATKRFVAEAVNEALALEHALHRLDTDRAVVALHYSPIAETVRGEPLEIAPFLGCSRLAETIDRFQNVRAVFHGHAHHGMPEGRTPRGVPVYNCSMDLVGRVQGRPYMVLGV
ncbi:MAG TPA: metallophosphoesterase [Phycisphaerales bacterium]|nr:metallophosphoesterase [Phycisphaerales bacterium]